MFTYEYRCKDCKKITEADRQAAERDEPCKCMHCGGDTRKIISLSQAHSDMRPYFDENLDTYITGRQHRVKVMKEQGVSEYFGKGWI